MKINIRRIKSIICLCLFFSIVQSNVLPGQSEAFVSFENGLHNRYGIEAIVYELNANWISGLKKMPSQNDWIKVGEGLNDVFYEYLNGLN